jgi:hypothetical protein
VSRFPIRRSNPFLATLASALVLLGVIVPAAAAQVGEWSLPVPLSAENTSSWFPEVAVDRSGEVHVAWSSGVTLGIGQAYDTVVYTSSPDGQLWSAPLDVVALPSKGAVTRPMLLPDSLGTLHMTYRSYMIYYSHTSTQAVSSPSMLPARPISSGDNGYFSQLVLGPGGGLHVFYTEYAGRIECPECLHVFHRVSADRGLTWSRPVDITPGPSGAAKPHVVIDGPERFHLVWEAGRGGDLGQLADPARAMYTASSDGGQTWREPIQLGTDEDQSRNVTLGIMGTGELVAVWLGLPGDALEYRTSRDQGATWSEPQMIPNAFGGWTIYQARTDAYTMVTDGAGVLHLLAVGRTALGQRSLSVLHMAWNGAVWSDPEAVVTMTGDVPEWPRAAVGLGNRLHVVWFVRDLAHIWGGEGEFRYRIWYANRPLEAPAQQPVVFPTLTPTSPAIEDSVSPTPPPTPTPPPASGPQLPASQIPVGAIPPAQVENRSLLLILESLIPVGLLLAGVVIVVYRRRR